MSSEHTDLPQTPWQSPSPEVIGYAWHQLAQRAWGVAGKADTSALNEMGVSFHYAAADQATSRGRKIIVTPCAPQAWRAVLEAPPHSLRWLPVQKTIPRKADLGFHEPIPVLFWGAGFERADRPFAELQSGGTLIFYVDIIATTVFMLSRWEETAVPTRDEHDRFPAIASVAYRQGFLDRPIVDEYALILRKWVEALIPAWTPKLSRFTVKLSHDIDHLCRFRGPRSAARAIVGDLLKRRSPRQAVGSVRDALDQVIKPHRTQYVREIDRLARLSCELGLTNEAFYFMADGPDPYGAGYDPQIPEVRKSIENLLNQGIEVGIHPSYRSYLDPSQLAKEKRSMDAILGKTQYGGRQHYLRFRAPDTWRHWEQTGLTYDSTVGYADHEGFRCGTCHPFRPFDLERNREIELWEVPLIVMDGTLRNYRRLTPDQGAAEILTLAHRCKQVEGTFTLLWHNSSLTGPWQPWGQIYRQVIRATAAMQSANSGGRLSIASERAPLPGLGGTDSVP